MNRMVQSGMAKKQIRKAIDALPPRAQEELAQFIEYLQYKYSSPEVRLTALGGYGPISNLTSPRKTFALSGSKSATI